MDAQQHPLHQLATDISFLQNAILRLPRSHPLRAPCVQILALLQLRRYLILKDLDDLEQSILHWTEALLFPLPWDRHCGNIILVFLFLAPALVHRAYESRQPEDVMRSIIYLRYLRGQSLEVLNDVQLNLVTRSLVGALGIQMEMKLGDVGQDIEEMAVLCHELLKSDVSTTSVIGFIMCLVQAVGDQFGLMTKRQGPFDKVIGCLREANARLPDSHPLSHHVSTALACSLYGRFDLTFLNDDYEEGITILDKVICTPGDGPAQLQTVALALATMFAQARYIKFGKLEYVEETIYRIRALLDKASLDDSSHHVFTRGLAIFRHTRFNNLGIASGLQEPRPRNSGVSMPTTTLSR